MNVIYWYCQTKEQLISLYMPFEQHNPLLTVLNIVIIVYVLDGFIALV